MMEINTVMETVITVPTAIVVAIIVGVLYKPSMDLAEAVCQRWFPDVRLSNRACVLCFAVLYSVALLALSVSGHVKTI